MGTIMLLGGSHCQLAAARKAKEMGHRVVLADYLESPPAKELCDEHIRVSTFDIRACTDAARQCKADGIFTAGSDQPVYTAAKVAQTLGLPSPISVDTALKATNKFAMKTAFDEHGVPNAGHVFLRRGEDAKAAEALQTPLVIKPLDSQGQRGVFKVRTAREAAQRLEETLSYSREDSALIESFYPSDEVTLSCFMEDGVMYPLTLTDRQLIDDPLHIGICAAHRYPSVYVGMSEEIHRIAGQVAQALGISQGPLYIQFLIGDDGIIVNEASARIGGAFEDVFIPWVVGFDLLEAVIRLTMGEKVSYESLKKAGHAGVGCQVSVQMPFCHPGRIASFPSIESLMKLPGMLSAGYNFSCGDAIPMLENATARFGHCVMVTEDGDMDTRVQRYYETLQVLDEDGNSLVIPRTYDGKG